MPATPDSVRRGGRRGRRTTAMVRVAQERIADLFALAERESTTEGGTLPDRYVRLARKVGTRYNIRLARDFRESFCRGCSSYWVEGRTVRTRLRGGHRVRTCLRCGRARRTRIKLGGPARHLPDAPSIAVPPEDQALVGPVEESTEEPEEDEGPEEA